MEWILIWIKWQQIEWYSFSAIIQHDSKNASQTSDTLVNTWHFGFLPLSSSLHRHHPNIHLLLWCLVIESYIFMFHNISYYITILLLPSWKRKCFEWNTENCLQARPKIMEKVTKQSRGLCGFFVKKWSDIFNTKTKPISLFLNLLSNSLECINKKVRKFDYIRVRFIDHTLTNVKPYLKCLGWDDTQFPMTSWSFYSFILLHRK